MTQKINPVPKGYRTVTPGLVVRDVDAALEFYRHVFEATAGTPHYEAGGERVAEVELKIGGSLILLSEEMLEWGLVSPLALGGTASGQKVFVEDPDAVFGRALESGARGLLPVTQVNISERSDERLARFIDPFGHAWTVAARVPAEPAVREDAPSQAPDPASGTADPTDTGPQAQDAA